MAKRKTDPKKKSTSKAKAKYSKKNPTSAQYKAALDKHMKDVKRAYSTPKRDGRYSKPKKRK